jgi:electron transfer flavoprotein beta subunit
MNIFVMMKRTFDTEERIVIKNGQIREGDAEFIINPYDEYAVEEAIVLKEKHGGEVTVVTVGDEEGEAQLRTTLAMGADKAVLINIEELDHVDSFTVASILVKYLEKQEIDLILAGNMTIDGGSAQIGPLVAEGLGLAQVTAITKLEVNERKVLVVRDVEGDVETIEVSLPVLMTAQQGLNEPRYPSLPGIMKAKKKPLEILEFDDLDIDEEDVEAKTSTVEVFLPQVKQAGRRLDGDAHVQVKQLVSLLSSEAKVI